MKNLKQVIIVRKDIKMGKGKLCAQVAHASLSSFLETKKKFPNWCEEWLKEGQKKIVLKVGSLEELLEIKRKFDELNIPNALILDAGCTQLPPGTITCLGVGPAPEEILDKVVGNLKLL